MGCLENCFRLLTRNIPSVFIHDKTHVFSRFSRKTAFILPNSKTNFFICLKLFDITCMLLVSLSRDYYVIHVGGRTFAAREKFFCELLEQAGSDRYLKRQPIIPNNPIYVLKTTSLEFSASRWICKYASFKSILLNFSLPLSFANSLSVKASGYLCTLGAKFKPVLISAQIRIYLPGFLTATIGAAHSVIDANQFPSLTYLCRSCCISSFCAKGTIQAMQKMDEYFFSGRVVPKFFRTP